MVMSPQNFAHYAAIDKAAEVLRGVFGPGFWVRTQAPLELGQSSDPEPDVSVVAGRREDYSDHPTTAVLVVEVSDTTLAFDRGDKANLYAAAGIADYWVIDVNGRRVEVYRDPTAGPGEAVRGLVHEGDGVRSGGYDHTADDPERKGGRGKAA